MAKTKYKQLQAASNPDPMEIEHRGLVIEWRSAVITANANLVQIDEHLADHPWESPPLIAEAHKGCGSRPDSQKIPRQSVSDSSAGPRPLTRTDKHLGGVPEAERKPTENEASCGHSAR